MKSLSDICKILSCSLYVVFLIACSKTDAPNPENSLYNGSVISSKDSSLLAASTTVLNGSIVNEETPVFNSSTSLKISLAQNTIQVASFRYAFIVPKIVTGKISSYGLKILGSKKFFKASALYRDSAVVVCLPPNIKAGDVINAIFWAYDEEGQTSNFVEIKIYTAPTISENAQWLLGKWNCTSSIQRTGKKILISDTTIFNTWEPSYKIYRWNNHLWCEVFEGTLTHEEGNSSWNIPKPDDAEFVDYIDQRFVKEHSYTFYSKNFAWYFLADHKGVDYQKSTVDKIKYQNWTDTSKSNDLIPWKYYPSNNMLIFAEPQNITEDNQYTLAWYPETVSTNNIVLLSTMTEDGEIYYYRLRMER